MNLLRPVTVTVCCSKNRKNSNYLQQPSLLWQWLWHGTSANQALLDSLSVPSWSTHLAVLYLYTQCFSHCLKYSTRITDILPPRLLHNFSWFTSLKRVFPSLSGGSYYGCWMGIKRPISDVVSLFRLMDGITKIVYKQGTETWRHIRWYIKHHLRKKTLSTLVSIIAS